MSQDDRRGFFWTTIATVVALTAIPWQNNAEAQVVCTTRGEILGALSRSYSEQPTALGVASNGAVMELLTSENGATWTLIMTMPSGETCVIASGESWMSIPRKVAGSPT